MGYLVEYAGGGKVNGHIYKTVDNAEKKAVAEYEKTGRPTVVVDERYRRGKKAR